MFSLRRRRVFALVWMCESTRVSGKCQIRSKVATESCIQTDKTTNRVTLRTNPGSVPTEQRYRKNSSNWASEISEG